MCGILSFFAWHNSLHVDSVKMSFLKVEWCVHCVYIHSLLDGLCVSATVNKVAVNMVLPLFLQHTDFVSFQHSRTANAGL